MKSFRVYFIRHAPDRVSGILMERYDRLFMQPLSAIGSSEEEVLSQLEDARGPSNRDVSPLRPWTALAQSLFSLKEFLYLR